MRSYLGKSMALRPERLRLERGEPRASRVMVATGMGSVPSVKMDIPIGYLYGNKFRGPLTPLVEKIRQEIYTEPYQNIDFSRHRNNVHPCDVFYPRHPVGKLLNEVALVCENFVPSLFRRKALDSTYKLVVYEDENTQYQSIAPVSKMLNMVCRFAAEGPDSDAFKQHLAKIDDFLWMSEEGLMMTGTNGSQLWDLAFISQAVVESGLAEVEANKESCSRALDWLDKAQIRNDPKWFKEAYRHRSKGAWPFSTPEQGYMVSDCAGEGLKAVLALQSLKALAHRYLSQKVDDRRLEDCVDLLLTMQNTDGGFASYELVRGSNWLEWLSNSEVFDTPSRKPSSICMAPKRLMGLGMVPGQGICFTYATMFALEALGLAGETYSNSASVRKACAFLVSHQMMDGGWGETYLSCVKDEYSQHETSQVVQTSWAILGLIYAQYPDKQVIRRACQLIMHRQQPDGSWLQEDAEGIFNKNCVIDYPNYKFSFPIWALGKASEYLASCEALGKER
ncbi:hypothetical protein QFC22_004812 [Naganishia vaughanmartiniae]|uniref:Uncharacterized protein n=1 Tax=Naganishia vaughanmartiniae TaxID=1424756 RepID=A0ACC2WZ02_9TREE|nr:hypothetical protein QFC22_004812 [Naganishia vaughanmartiniae]